MRKGNITLKVKIYLFPVLLEAMLLLLPKISLEGRIPYMMENPPIMINQHTLPHCALSCYRRHNVTKCGETNCTCSDILSVFFF